MLKRERRRGRRRRDGGKHRGKEKSTRRSRTSYVRYVVWYRQSIRRDWKARRRTSFAGGISNKPGQMNVLLDTRLKGTSPPEYSFPLKLSCKAVFSGLRKRTFQVLRRGRSIYKIAVNPIHSILQHLDYAATACIY